MFQIQRPATWLFNALGVITGGAAQRLWGDVTPSVDVAQLGMGLAEGPSFVNIEGQDAFSTFVEPLPVDEVASGKYAFLLRFSGINSGDVATLVQISYLKPGGAAFFHLAKFEIPAAAGAIEGRTFWNFITHNQFYFVPAGHQLFVQVGPGSLGIAQCQLEWFRVPAGTRPW